MNRFETARYRHRARARLALLLARVDLARAVVASLAPWVDTDEKVRRLWKAAFAAYRRLEEFRAPRDPS